MSNLSIDKADFDAVPVMSDPGGWGGSEQVFDGKLDEQVARLNEVLAA